MVAGEQIVHGSNDDIIAEARAHFLHSARGNATGSDERVQIGGAPIGLAGLVHDQLDQVFVIDAALVDLDRRNAHALFENRAGVDWHRAGDLAADIGLMTEHSRPGDEAAIAVHRQQHQPVVGVADRAFAAVRVGEQDHVPLLDSTVEVADEAIDEAAKLADDHLAIGVGDQRKGITLLADARRHGGAHQRCVHFDTGVTQRVLDDIEGDRIDLLRREGGVIGLDDLGGHRFSPQAGLIKRLPKSSTSAVWPLWISVVESISVTTAGPGTRSPARSLLRS